MKKQIKTTQKDTKAKPTGFMNWKNRREMVSKSIPLEVDLENRQLFFQQDIQDKLHFEFNTNNIDNLIKTYVDPKDSRKVKQSLTRAKKGLEKPIQFNFIHPETARSFSFEYRYQIIYVKYSSTRLQGELVKLPDVKLKKQAAAPGKKSR